MLIENHFQNPLCRLSESVAQVCFLVKYENTPGRDASGESQVPMHLIDYCSISVLRTHPKTTEHAKATRLQRQMPPIDERLLQTFP
jgi:hypothetical protein